LLAGCHIDHADLAIGLAQDRQSLIVEGEEMTDLAAGVPERDLASKCSRGDVEYGNTVLTRRIARCIHRLEIHLLPVWCYGDHARSPLQVDALRRGYAVKQAQARQSELVQLLPTEEVSSLAVWSNDEYAALPHEPGRKLTNQAARWQFQHEEVARRHRERSDSVNDGWRDPDGDELGRTLRRRLSAQEQSHRRDQSDQN
jgi:hypothetical protein